MNLVKRWRSDQVALHALAPQVEVAVFQAQVLVDVAALAVDHEGRRLGRVQHLQLGDADFDVAGGHLGVVHALGAQADRAFDLDDEFAAQRLGQLEHVGGDAGAG